MAELTPYPKSLQPTTTVLPKSRSFSSVPATMASTTEEKVYHPKDAITAATKTTLLTSGIGLFTSAVQNTLLKRNIGPWGVLTRTGTTIGIFGESCCLGVEYLFLWSQLMLTVVTLGAMGGTYEFVKIASANLREKEDPWNVALAGFFSGSILGLRGLSHY